MKITLIKPNIGRMERQDYVDEGRMEPLMLGVLAGLTPPDVEVVIHDDRMEPIPYDRSTDLVAITVETFTAKRAYEIADEYRKRGVPVILGGVHTTLIPEESVQFADSIFIGDAETLWGQVVEDARMGKLKPRYQAPPGVAQMNGVLPRRELFAGKGYLPISLMQFSRGCRFECSFCAISQYFRQKHYIRRIDEVLREISEQERKLVFFVDDNIASDLKALRELCAALVPMKINWVSQASLDITHHEKLLELMVESGCLGNVMGFESITPGSLREAKKSPNLPGFTGYGKEVETLRRFGLQTWAAFTLGYDSDTYETIIDTLKFARNNRFTFAAFNILMPYPNTPFYNRLQREGRLLYDGKWWLHPEYRFNRAAFVPHNMSPEELTEACQEARTRFNSIPSMLYRFADLKTNMHTLWRIINYWRYGNLFRKEVYKKHLLRFGLG